MSGIGRRFLALGGGEVFARLCSFGATIYLAHVLSPAYYGVIGVVMGVMLYLNQLADGGIELVGMPFIARERHRVAEAAAPVLSARFAAAVVMMLLTVLISLTLLPAPDGPLLALASLGLLATALSTRWIHLGLEGSGAVAIARTLGEIAALLLIVAFVKDTGDVAVVPVALFLGAGVASVLMLLALRRRGISIPWRWDPRSAAPVFRRSRSLLLFTLLGLILFNFDLIFLRISAGAADAGLYAAAYTLVAFFANVIVAFAHTVLPTLVRLEHDVPERNATYVTACAQAFALALPVGIGAAYVAPYVVPLVFGAEYVGATTVLSWLALTIPLAALRELPVIGLLAAHREDRLLRVNGYTVLANVGLIVAVVPRYGLTGAAIATVLTEVLRLLLAVAYARQSGLPVVPPGRLMKPLLASGAMGAGLVLLRPGSLWSAVALGLVSFGTALALVRGVRRVGGVPVLDV
jgi:O-antigen/teichoic acid export membrane protein